jgi:hypothetical protein
MKTVDSLALGLVDRALGLAGAGTQQTELEDGLVVQTLDVSRLVARARAPISDGIKTAIFQNVHGGAGQNETALDPYFHTSSPGSNPHWPVPVPVGFDVWVLAVSADVNSVGNFVEAQFSVLGDHAGDAAFTQDSSGGAASASTIRLGFCHFDSARSIAGDPFLMTEQGDLIVYPQIRVPRGMTLSWTTETTGAAVMNCFCMMGLFPVGLNQDATT